MHTTSEINVEEEERGSSVQKKEIILERNGSD